MPEVISEGSVLKVNDELRTVYGFASVVQKGDNPVADRQGDIIREIVLTKAAHQYVMEERAGKVMHAGKRMADVVESIVFTKDIQKALGIEIKDKDGDQIVPWFIGMRIQDDDLWDQVKKGEFTSFSIGGSGIRYEVPENV